MYLFHRRLWLICLFTTWIKLPCQAQYQLRVEVSGLRSANGQVHALLFRQAKGFPDRPSSSYRQKSISLRDHSSIILIFDSLPPGIYAVSLIHDENGDGHFNTNWLGIPVEGFGCSGSWQKIWKKPNFQHTAFPLQTDTTVKVRVHYFF